MEEGGETRGTKVGAQKSGVDTASLAGLLGTEWFIEEPVGTFNVLLINRNINLSGSSPVFGDSQPNLLHG